MVKFILSGILFGVHVCMAQHHTDYGGDDRTHIVYAEQFAARKGDADGWQAGLARQLPVTNKFSITSSLGYGIFHQTFYLSGNTAAFSDLNNQLNEVRSTGWG